MSICPVILAGGSGTRLWPLSRADHPKQFLALINSESMLQATVSRLSLLDILSPITICNEEHRFFVAEQLRQIDSLGTIILEQDGRNTAPAVAMAALAAADDPLLLVLAADHLIEDKNAFVAAVNDAIPLAEEGKLVTFGVVPTSPCEGYGYIKRGTKLSGGYTVEEFVEKPSKSVAVEYCSSGKYYWNSGMFLFRASRYLEELGKYSPLILKACQSAANGFKSDMDFLRMSADEFHRCPSDSVDYAVMEKTTEAVVIPMDAGWSDIGSWSSLWDVTEKDKNGNFESGDTLLYKVKDSYIRSEHNLVTAIGVENLVIVSTKDCLMVANKDHVQEIKTIVDKLKAESRPEWKLSREVYRPWGKFDSIDSGHRYQVKLITVNPGAKLSVQMHKHRSEHWVVVSGIAKVRNGDNTFLLNENESTFIPVGVVHSLENPGKAKLELIEVQVGSYLGEDDIVRFDDRYGREIKKF